MMLTMVSLESIKKGIDKQSGIPDYVFPYGFGQSSLYYPKTSGAPRLFYETRAIQSISRSAHREIRHIRRNGLFSLHYHNGTLFQQLYRILVQSFTPYSQLALSPFFKILSKIMKNNYRIDLYDKCILNQITKPNLPGLWNSR